MNLSEQKKKRPVIEQVSIKTTVQDIQLNQPFVKVSRMIAFYEWEAITVDYSEFAGSAALTEGVQLQADKKLLSPVPIKSLSDHMRLAFDNSFKIDTAGVTKHAYFASRLSFHRFMGNEEGIDLTQYPLIVKVQDDLSAIGTDLALIFEGWTWDR